MKKLPIGIQSIDKLLKEGYVYVDKTDYAKRLITEGSPCNFISRPRRFGKSLFLSTLKEIFKGNKQLFEGCAIHKSDYDWKEYPVVHFDFAAIANTSPQELETSLKIRLEIISQEHGVSIINNDLERLLKRAVLNRKNAYFYRTEEGARIGDILMSTIETCVMNNVNPWKYLLAIQEHQEKVKKRPELWLPWVYEKELEKLVKQEGTAHSQ